MKLTILGSAAAEAWPAIFCVCDICQEAWRRGGPDLRRRTAYALDTDTLIDPGPDLHWQSHACGLHLGHLQRILVTHSHSDHLAAAELYWRTKGFSAVAGAIDFLGNQQVLDRVTSENGQDFAALAMVPHLLRPGEAVTSGDLSILPLRAQHAGDEEALNFILRRGGRSLLIANDTGWWPEESWALAAGQQLDAAVIECTYGVGFPDRRNGHLGAAVSLEFRDRLLASGGLKPDARVLVNHFTHNGAGLHADLCAFFEPHGVSVCYDGLVVEV